MLVCVVGLLKQFSIDTANSCDTPAFLFLPVSIYAAACRTSHLHYTLHAVPTRAVVAHCCVL